MWHTISRRGPQTLCALVLAIESDSLPSDKLVSNLSPIKLAIDTQDQTCCKKHFAICFVSAEMQHMGINFDKFRQNFRTFRNEVQSDLRKIRTQRSALMKVSFFTKGCHRCGYRFRRTGPGTANIQKWGAFGAL